MEKPGLNVRQRYLPVSLKRVRLLLWLRSSFVQLGSGKIRFVLIESGSAARLLSHPLLDLIQILECSPVKNAHLWMYDGCQAQEVFDGDNGFEITGPYQGHVKPAAFRGKSF